MMVIVVFTGFQDVLFGRWVSGYNAGGQVSNQNTFYSNPQIVFDVPDRPEGGRLPGKCDTSLFCKGEHQYF